MSIWRNEAFELEGAADLPAALLRELRPDDRPPHVFHEGLLLIRLQLILRIHVEVGLGVDREIREEVLPIRLSPRRADSAAKPVELGDALDPGHRFEARLVGNRQVLGKADAMTGDQPLRARSLEPAVERLQRRLQHRNQEDAQRHRDDSADGSDPGLAQVLQDVRQVFHQRLPTGTASCRSSEPASTPFSR